MMDYIAQVLAPDRIISLARGDPEAGLSEEQKQRADELVKMVQPGDFILTRTPSAVFGIFRDVGSTQYDHAVCVIDEARSLHIAYPYAKLVPTKHSLYESKQPLLIRPKALKNQEEFIHQLKHRLVGKPYDY